MNAVESFERAFVAVSYLLGRREGLLDGLAQPTPIAERAAELALAGDQRERATRLAAELLPVVTALEARRPR